MKIAYLKTNNAVAELNRVGNPPKELPEGGPDAYVAHLLNVAAGCPSLIMSTHFAPFINESAQQGNALAYSFYWGPFFQLNSGKLIASPVFKIFHRVRNSFRILMQLIRFRPDVILCWSSSIALWAVWLAAKTLSVPMIYSRHTRIVSHNQSLLKKYAGTIDRYIIRKSAFVVVHGPYLRKQMQLIRVQPDKIIEFNWSFKNFRSTSLHKAASVFPTSWRKSKVILYVGRLETGKGVIDLLEASKDILQNDSTCKLAYVGKGSAYKQLQHRISESKLADKVMLLGQVDHRRLPTIIDACHMVVTPTKRDYPEGRCMATMEGLIMGKPVIAPDDGPFPFLVEHGQNGLLYKPDSLTDLRDKITTLTNNASLYKKLRKGALASGKSLTQNDFNYSQALKFVLANLKIKRFAHQTGLLPFR